jgi:hypothetical protein
MIENGWLLNDQVPLNATREVRLLDADVKHTDPHKRDLFK